MTLLRLMALGALFEVRLPTLRVRDLLLPALAGMGRTETWWNVLPIVRVCGSYQPPKYRASDCLIASLYKPEPVAMACDGVSVKIETAVDMVPKKCAT